MVSGRNFVKGVICTLKRFVKATDCTQNLQLRENVMGSEKAVGAVKVIKDKIQYRSQSLLNLVCGYFSKNGFLAKREVKLVLSVFLTKSKCENNS